MNRLTRNAVIGVVALFLVMASLLFVPTWMLDWWQGWLFLAIYFAASIALTLYLVRHDRALLERRMRGGPWAEKQPAQRVIMLIATAAFVALILVPAFDRRYGWSDMPTAVMLAGDVMVALSWLGIFFVFRENSFTSATVELAPDQRVISTGPYAIVRHPMYASAFFLVLGTPIALGSWWGVLGVAVFMPVLIWRLLDEERFLTNNLAGYAAYKEKVRYRLIPGVW